MLFAIPKAAPECVRNVNGPTKVVPPEWVLPFPRESEASP